MPIDNCVLKHGKPQMYLFDGGYYSFDGDKKPECHYYVQDYQGNNRMVVNADKDSVEQITHYYPYGGIIGNLSSNQEAQKYKYSGKEFDRTYGLDLYDFHARLFNPALPVFDRPDPLAEKYYSISPYAYCAGDPVNCVDTDGRDYQVCSDDKTITISANIYIKPALNGNLASYIAANNAAYFWISQSGKFVADGKIVNFNIQVIQTESNLRLSVSNDPMGNRLNVNDETLNANENGTTNHGNSINIRSTRINSETPAHELGHALGLVHEEQGESGGLMSPSSSDRNGNKDLFANQIKTIINNAISQQPESENNAKAGRGSLKEDDQLNNVKKVKQL